MLSAISAASAGFLFASNYYLPMIICFVFSLIATLISVSFEEIKAESSLSRKRSLFQNLRSYFSDLRQAFKFIFKSSRLKSLFAFSASMLSFLLVFITLKNALLYSLGVPPQWFGIIFAIALTISSISSRNQNWFHNKFRNKTLFWFAIPISISVLLTGLLIFSGLSTTIIYLSVTLMVIMVSIVRGAYFTLISRYYNNFSTPDVLTKIYTAKSLIENIVRFSFFMLASFLMGITTIDVTLIIFGALLIIFFTFILEYMKTRIGLSPEKYKAKDIAFKI